jgi:hypothetical protein
MTMVRFTFLTGDCNFVDYGGKWISNRQNNGEFDYYFVIELLNWRESVGEREAKEIGSKYHISLSVVAPSQVSENNMQQAYNCSGIGADTLRNAETGGYLANVQAEALHGYSGGTQVYGANGNNWQSLMRLTKRESRQCASLLGFYLDRPVNRLGMTGWESIKLTDTRTVLERVLSEGSETSQTALMDKLIAPH